jgi:cold shock CspA family protein
LLLPPAGIIRTIGKRQRKRNRGGSELPTGRVLQFDETRGYGFIAAEDGGDDIFLHSSVFNGYPDMLAPGTLVEFKVMAGDRGRKAYDARLTDDGYEQIAASVAAAKRVPAAEKPVAAALKPVPAPRKAEVAPEQDDEQMCDVLSEAEFKQALTELLVNAVPDMTGAQIVKARQSVIEFAREHGWSDN